MQRAMGLRSRISLVLSVVLWVALIAVGIDYAVGYETTPGPRSDTPSSWPRESTLPRRAGGMTLVMFVHPQCSCSRSSLSELSAIVNAHGVDVAPIVAFIEPEHAADDWKPSASWGAASDIPHTTRFVDRGGVEARRFGAHTSGHVVLYDQHGTLRFSGGITGSRGHEGDNLGRRIVIAQLTSSGEGSSHAVFGCPLLDEKRDN